MTNDYSPRRGRPLLALLPLLAALILAIALPAPAPAAAKDFSFLVLGDTRGETYLPIARDQAEQTSALLELRYKVRPKLFFDQSTGLLSRVEIPDRKGKGRTVITYRQGWPQVYLRGEGKKMRIHMRRWGRQWVYDRVVQALARGARGEAGAPQFALHTGDLILGAIQGAPVAQSPYWQDFLTHFLGRVPPAGPGLGLPGRFFPCVGNHETWGDPNMVGLLGAVPYLPAMGLTSGNRTYSFAFKGCRFIFLDSGGYESGKEGWLAHHPDFAGQMKQLTGWLQKARAEGSGQVFVVYHKPSYCQAGHGPLPADQNPHRFLKPFAKKLDITVFNGHVHTTEAYRKDGIRYLVLGGGGAPQKFKPTPRPNYPPELYWQGGRRVEEYNYLTVTLAESGPRFFLHRFRPGQVAAPMQVVELFNK